MVKDTDLRNKLLNDSNLSPSGNGNKNKDDKDYICLPPTSGQKWWAAVILGVTASIITSPPVLQAISGGFEKIGGTKIYEGPGLNMAGWLLMMIILILVFRLIMG